MSKKRVAVIGCGRISAMYKQVFLEMQDKLEIVYAIDKDINRANDFASNFTGCSALNNYRDLNKGMVDVVHILTPHFLHKEHSIYCMEQGFNVLCEKPIATTLEDAKEIIECVDRTHSTYGIIFQNRYTEGIQKLIEIKNSGELGKILGASSILTWHRPPSYYECDWKGTWAKEGGGVVIDQAIHSLDLVRYVVGSPMKSIDAHICQRKLFVTEVEDEADALIDFENGVSYSFYACNYYVKNSPIRIDFAFEKGTATLLGTEMTISIDNKEDLVIDSNQGVNVKGKGYWGNYHGKQIADFYNNLETKKAVPFSAKDATKTLEMVLGIYKSSNINRKIYKDDFSLKLN